MTSVFSRLIPKSKPAWQIVWPLGLVLVLAVVWSVYWLVASKKAMEILDHVLERQKAKGVSITCGERQISGYPFKFLLTCNKLSIIKETPTRLTELKARRLVVAVRAYNYNHMIGELFGPFEITRGRKRDVDATVVETRKLFYGNARTITSSLVLKNRVVKEATIVIRDLSATLVDYTIKTAPQNIATNLKEAIIYLRSTQDTDKPIGAYHAGAVIKDLVLVGGAANIQSNKGTRLDDFDVRLDISNAPYKLIGKPLDWLKIWKANKGEAKITHLSATSGVVRLKGTGRFNLDNLGRAQGILKTQMSGLDSLLDELVLAGRIRQQDANLGLAAITLMGNAGAGRVKIIVRAQKGNLYFGPFKIAVLKPLFK